MEINNKEKWMMLDPVKISLTGLSEFLNKYQRLYITKDGEKEEHLNENGTLTEKLERLELLSKDENISENDRKDMKSILDDLNKIMKCNLCHKQINWDNGDGLYSIQPKIEVRHKSCHENSESKA